MRGGRNSDDHPLRVLWQRVAFLARYAHESSAVTMRMTSREVRAYVDAMTEVLEREHPNVRE